MTTTLIQEIREALVAATKGPWDQHSTGYYVTKASGNPMSPLTICGTTSPFNTYLIANAPTWLESLCTLVESQQAEIEKWKERCKSNHENGKRQYEERVRIERKLEKAIEALRDIKVNTEDMVTSLTADITLSSLKEGQNEST